MITFDITSLFIYMEKGGHGDKRLMTNYISGYNK